MISATSVSALVAFGSVDRLAKLSMATLTIRLICLPTGYYFGQSIGMCIAVLVSGMLTMSINLATQQYVGALSLKRLFQLCWRLCIASGLMYLTLRLIIPVLPSDMPLALSLGVQVLAGVVSFGLALIASWHLSGKPKGCEQQILAFIDIPKYLKILKTKF